ncbi:hypothetical protein D3C81_1941560 [compost metagenome]
MGEISKARFPAVMLQVGVGDKADDGIERQGLFQGSCTVGVQRKSPLKPQDEITESDQYQIGSQKADCVFLPGHALAAAQANQLVDSSLNSAEDPVCPVRLVGKHMV